MAQLSDPQETQRLAALHALHILDTPAEQAYDDIAFLASQICGTPIALISLVDRDRQWFKARVGMDSLQTPRDEAFCAHAIRNPQHVMEVPDATQDIRFMANPLVTADHGIRFYAGAPLLTDTGEALGTLCVIDNVPRRLTAEMQLALEALSRQVGELLRLRHANAALEQARTQVEEANRVLREQALTDGLTGVRNRRSLDLKLTEELDRAARHHAPLVILLIDIDHFKTFNDRFGHLVGDDVLRLVAQAIASQARSYDHVARFGGEEFAVLLPGTSMAEALVVAERMRARVEAMEGAPSLVTVSIGAAQWNKAMTSEALLAAADTAMYTAKSQGRNQVASST